MVMTSGGGAVRPGPGEFRAMRRVYPLLAVRGCLITVSGVRFPQPTVLGGDFSSTHLPAKRCAACRNHLASGFDSDSPAVGWKYAGGKSATSSC